jgi:HemY protein
MTSRPVRWALWLLLLAIIAVGVALAGRHGTGFFVLVVPPWRVESSALMFFLMLATLFAALYMAIRLGVRAYGLPREVRRMRKQSARDTARDQVLSSLAMLFSGRFKDAETAAREAMSHAETRDLAAALAAWAAYEGGSVSAAAPYLDAIRGEASTKMRDVSRAYMLLAEGKAPEALALLKTLAAEDPKNPGVLKMKVEAEMAGKAWDDVLATLEPLTRSGLLPESAARQLRLNAEINRVKTIAAGAQHLEETWRRMPDEIRLEAAMAGAVAKRLIGLGEGERARQVIEEAVERRGAHHWDSTLAALYAKCNTESTLQQIERAESWLHAQPRDAALLATLGTLCMRASLWGKAQSYLEASVALQPTLDAHMTLARLMEQLGRREEAITHIRRSAELAGA